MEKPSNGILRYKTAIHCLGVVYSFVQRQATQGDSGASDTKLYQKGTLGIVI